MPGDDFGYETDSDDEVDETLVAVQVVMERRRLAAAAAARRQKSGPRGKKRRPFSFFSWEDHKHRLSERDFKLRYRLTVASFDRLHGLIKADIDTKNKAQVSQCTFLWFLRAPVGREFPLISLCPPPAPHPSSHRPGGPVRRGRFLPRCALQ